MPVDAAADNAWRVLLLALRSTPALATNVAALDLLDIVDLLDALDLIDVSDEEDREEIEDDDVAT